MKSYDEQRRRLESSHGAVARDSADVSADLGPVARPTVGGVAFDQHTDLQREAVVSSAGVIGLEGGQVDDETERTLRSNAGGGSPIAQVVRGPLETAFDADFSGVRLHAGAEATALNQGMSAAAFTHGQDIYFRDGLPDTSTDGGLHLLAHELTHTVQQQVVRRKPADGVALPVQRKAVVGPANDATELEAERVADSVVQAIRSGALAEVSVDVQPTADDGIHRHAAYEHYLLGELQPRQIEMIPTVRQVRKNKEQKERLKKAEKRGEPKGLADDDPTQLATAQHLIDREMERLLAYRKDPEALKGRAGEKGEVKKGGSTQAEKNHGIGLQDTEYQVPIVVLTCQNNEQIVVSYSEMNTMPDLFGNPEAIAQTPKKQVLALLQGVRQQLYIELSNIRAELFGKANNKLDRTIGLDDDFEGARGPRAQAVNEGAYEIRTESQVNTATTRKGQEHEQYFAALERNACHFAPASWQQWRAYHEKARHFATASAMATAKAQKARQNVIPDAKEIEGLEVLAKDYANDAMIQNSFGEHYLQDSFASGHLIDKTKIMQWFAQWADKDKGGMGSTPSAKAAWSMAMHAATSELKSNPQMLHDKGVRGEFTRKGAKGPVGAAAEIGMDVDAQNSQEIVLMMRWRALAQAKPAKRTLTKAQAVKEFGKSSAQLDPLLQKLVERRFVEVDEPYALTRAVKGALGRSAETKYILQQEMVNVLNEGATERRGLGKGNVGGHVAYSAGRGHGVKDKQGKNTGVIDDTEAEAAAAEFNLASYNTMLSNAYVGAATKYFHDMFCKQGLVVETGEGKNIGRIYGDANMLNAGGQEGVRYAAETSRMSRDSVFDLISGADPKTVPTADDIQKRFPVKVVYNSTKPIPLVDFNNKLELVIKDETKLLNPVSSNKARAGYKVMDGISDKGALNVASLSHGPF